MEISNGTARTTPNALITASRSFFFGILIAAMGRATTLRNNYACPAQVPNTYTRPAAFYQHWPPLPRALGPSFPVKGCTEPPKSPPFLVCTTPIATTMVSHVPRPLNDEITAAMFVPRSKSKGARCDERVLLLSVRSLEKKKKKKEKRRADASSRSSFSSSSFSPPLPSPRETTIFRRNVV